MTQGIILEGGGRSEIHLCQILLLRLPISRQLNIDLASITIDRTSVYSDPESLLAPQSQFKGRSKMPASDAGGQEGGATAGIGFAFGSTEEDQVSIPIIESLDAGQKRTSQRAELLAATAASDYMVDADRLNEPLAKKRHKKATAASAEKTWVIATDSEYVVKGMTEWLPEWKENNLRTNRGTKPANLDLFLRLDEALAVEERKQDVKIGFWHVPREYNKVADRLAKEAAQLGDPER
ncbi:hypothetical protein G7Y79_00041g077460 [Physcia stellaris]|nr:hypothetical protein G7Y79_00041g077460 [Physcia stellaris]